MAKTAGLSEEELDIQFKRRDFIYLQKGSLEKARKEGRTAEKIAIAKKSLRQGLDTHIIASITGLSLEEIRQLGSASE